MAKPIEIGLELEGQDLIDFYEYLENPRPAPAAVACMKRAMKMKAERDALLCKQ